MIFYLLFFTCTNDQINVEKQYYMEYNKAVQLYQKGDLYQAISLLESLQKKDRESRAIVELLLYWYLEAESFDKGVLLSENLLQTHPGDSEIRIVHSKFLLKINKYQEASQDLQILLHNKKIHLWEIASDPFYRQYSHVSELNRITDFKLITLQKIVIPQTVLVGDIAIGELSILHLSSCNPTIEAQGYSNRLQLEKLHINFQKIDQWVSKSTLLFNWKVLNSGDIEITDVTISCNEYSTKIDLGTITSVSLNQDYNSIPLRPIILLPALQEIADTVEGLPVTFREHGIIIKEGKYLLPEGNK